MIAEVTPAAEIVRIDPPTLPKEFLQMTKKTICFLLLAAAGLFCNGCLYQQFHKVNDFDLEVEPAGAGNVMVAVLRNTSSSGVRIQSRTNFDLTRDPYNCWAMEPGALITTALNRALTRDGVQPQIVFQGEIDCFEADFVNRVFRLSGFYYTVPRGKKIRFAIAAPLRGKSVQNIVLAASEAVRQLAVRIAADGKNSR